MKDPIPEADPSKEGESDENDENDADVDNE